MGRFIKEVESDDPSTLFAVTGDHAERFDFATDVSLWALSGIPCYFYGDGITPDYFTDQTAGSHLQIAPTLAELILPPGSAYESLLPPLTQSDKAFNYKLYIEDGQIGEERDLKDVDLKRTIEAARTAAIWRITQGNALP